MPNLSPNVLMKVKVLSSLYFFTDCVRQFTFADRHAKAVSALWSIFTLAPVAFLNGVIFYWIVASLSSSIQALKDKQQTQKLRLFQRLWYTLVFSLLLGCLGMVAQMYLLVFNVRVRSFFLFAVE